ncbi:MAG: LysM peptidoglycan-binding domain-containing protein [Phycisphaerae bacterium]
MALSAKICLLACLFFTSGTCWLVANVAKPVVNLPTAALGSSSPAVGRASTRGPETSPIKRAAKLERPTPTLETAGSQRDAQLDVVAVRDEPVNQAPVHRVQLPPLVAPPVEAMTVAHVEPVTNEPAATNRPLGEASMLLVAQTTMAPPAADADEVLKPESGTAKITEVTLNTPVQVENGGSYTVKRGDSLSKIAKAMLGSDSQAAIRKLIDSNPALKKRPNVLLAGQVLTIPGAAVASEPVAFAANAEAAKPSKKPVAKATPVSAAANNPPVATVTRKDAPAKKNSVARAEKPTDAGKPTAARLASAAGPKSATAGGKNAAKPNAKAAAKTDPKKPTAKGGDAKGGNAKSSAAAPAKKGDTKAVSAAGSKEKSGKRG